MLKKLFIAAAAVVIFALPAGIAIYALSEVQQLQAAVVQLQQVQTTVTQLQNQVNPPESYAMRSVGTGGDGVNPYIEWVGLYPESTLYPIPGAPSLRFKDQAPVEGQPSRDFEIGFYKYGPTWYTANHIVEFWIGSGFKNGQGGGILSIAGNNNGGGEVNVRNPTDTDGIRIEYHRAGLPTLSTETGIPLHFSARDGLVSENLHSFEGGIAVPSSSGYAGQVIGGTWNEGSIVVETSAVSANSIVLVTPLTEPKGRWWVSQEDDGSSFTVSSTDPAESMDFNWLIIGGDSPES